MTQPYENFQYNSCVSRGICSLSPKNSALQTVIVLYLRIFAKYSYDIEVDKEIKTFILNTISVTLFNVQFNEESYLFAIENFKKILPGIIASHPVLEYQTDLKTEKEKFNELLKETDTILKAIKYGEKIYRRSQKEIEPNIQNLFNIMLILIKSLSIKLLELETYDKEYDLAYKKILHLLSYLNIENNTEETLTSEIVKGAKVFIELSRYLFSVMEERFGKQTLGEVSYSTIKNKAVLVTGTNIRELENVLEALKSEDIDVYTHDDMMLAYTFSKFREYSHLKGQFGYGLENCLLDFSTFPGPIVLTKNSLHNIENFYRGRLFTTDYTTSPKGIIKIENNDFQKVIESSYDSKGFKRGKVCEKIEIGYDFENFIKTFNEKIATNNYDRIFLLAQDDFSVNQKAYFEKLIKLSSKNTLIISFSYKSDLDNFIYINMCFDYFSLIRIFDYIYKSNLPITIFIPKCHRDSISQMIYFASLEKVKLFLGNCTSIILNPALLKTLEEFFNISLISTVKKDLEQII